jgi:hypothetical protein
MVGVRSLPKLPEIFFRKWRKTTFSGYAVTKIQSQGWVIQGNASAECWGLEHVGAGGQTWQGGKAQGRERPGGKTLAGR